MDKQIYYLVLEEPIVLLVQYYSLDLLVKLVMLLSVLPILLEETKSQGQLDVILVLDLHFLYHLIPILQLLDMFHVLLH